MTRRVSRFFAAVLSVLFVVAPLVHVQAATLSGRRDIMSRQNPAVGSNHEIRFITPSGVDASTDTITIDFPSSFNLTAITSGDIDLFHGAITGFETNETIAGSAAAGVWGASVTSRTLTLTAPSDAALGEITVGDIVYVRIGTNAAGGTNQIVNPSGGGGAVPISIGGTFGDAGGIDVFIETSDTISISATVGTSTPSGGGGGGTSSDVTPPSILNVQVLNITTSTASVIWDTSEGATTYIVWGTDTSYGLGSFSEPSYLIGHSASLSSLPPGTLIHFRITAVDAAGNTTNSIDQTFSTLSVIVAPVISNVQIVAIGDTTAVITWDTNIPASSFVDFGLTAGYGSFATSPGDVTSHVVVLSGLSPVTLYHLRVQSTEPLDSLTSISGDFTFTTTGDVTAPTNVFGFTATPSDSQNELNWSNPSDLDFSFVRIRARTDGYPAGPDDGRLVYQGNGNSFPDTGLVNGETYYYANYAFDGTGNFSSGAFAQATPVGPVVFPPPPPPPPPIPPPATPPPTSPPAAGGGGSTTGTPIIPPGTSVTTTPPVAPPIDSVTTTPPIILPPVATSTSEIPEVTIHPNFFAGNGSISLEPDASGAIGIAPGTSVLVRVPVFDLSSKPVSAIVRVGTSVYALTPLPGSTDWGASFVPSRGIGRIPVTVQLTLEDGRVISATAIIETLPSGRILERAGITADLTPVQGANVHLFENVNGQWQEWQAALYGQSNPIITGAQGFYGFSVRNGQYRVVVEKEGYVTQQKDLSVTRNYVSVDVVLPIAIEIPIIGPILEVLQSEQARETATITAPVAVAIAIANVATAGSLFSVLNYLWFLLTQPILLIRRRKREKWGTVYNSLSKVPLDLVVVRLVQAQTGTVVQTSITDSKGRFTFRVRPGMYRIDVVKPGFVYPTVHLKGERQDAELLDLYHGEPIEIKEETNLAVNIPIDPITKIETPFAILFKRFLRRAQHAVSLLGVLVTLIALIIAPSWLMAGLVLIQSLTYLLFRRLALPKKPKEWGIIYDSASRKPLGTVIVRIFDKKFNKLLETQVTSPKGQYGFFASKSLYFVTAEKAGFKKYRTEDIDLANAKEAIIDKHIALNKVDGDLPKVLGNK